MVLNLVDTEVFGVDTNVFFTNDNDVERITEIIHNDKQLNIDSADDIKFAIDFIEKSKINTDDKLLSTMGKAFFGSTSIFEKVNEVADNIISKLNKELEILLSNSCSCKNDAGCECKRQSNTFKIAQRYMDEVIDPNGTMPAAEYNKMLAIFTMYNEWIMKR